MSIVSFKKITKKNIMLEVFCIIFIFTAIMFQFTSIILIITIKIFARKLNFIAKIVIIIFSC